MSIIFRLYVKCGGKIWADLAMPLTLLTIKAYKVMLGVLVIQKDGEDDKIIYNFFDFPNRIYENCKVKLLHRRK